MVYPHSYRTEHSETHTTNGEYGDYFRTRQSKKIKIQPDLLKILQWIDSNNVKIESDLNEAVRIQSIVSDDDDDDDDKYRGEVTKMVKHIEEWMVKLGAKFEVFNLGYEKVNGKKYKLPPVILARFKGTSKKTLCVYGNIDVRTPCRKRWDSDPWKVEERSKMLYGNGVAIGKGPLICWLNALLAFKQSQLELPINVKFIIECNYYNRSAGLKDFLMTQKLSFLYDIDYMVVCDSEWLDDKYPCISYGCVGMLHFYLTITKNKNTTTDPKEDMQLLCSRLFDANNQLTIPEFYKYVKQISPDEEHLCESITLNMEEMRKQLPVEMRSWSKSKLLMTYWRQPAIYIDDIETCTCDKKDETKVKRTFTIKLVPKQHGDNCGPLINDYIKQLKEELGIGNKLEIERMCETRPWLEDCTSLNYEAARRATIQIYKEDPNMIREDHDMKCINILEMAERNILLLPLTVKGSNGGGDNEHISKRVLFEAIKLIAAYLFQIDLLSNK